MKSKVKNFVWRLVLVCNLVLLAAVSIAEDNSQILDDLKSEIKKIVKDRDLPSVSYTLVDENGVQLLVSMGLADIETQRKATPDTLYRIGSTSKMFVALAVLKLVEEGKLSLRDTLHSLASEVEFTNAWEEEHPVRVVHLLEHTTGWDDSHAVEYAHSQAEPISLLEGLQFHPHSRTSRWVPGTRMAYTNSGPPVAAYVVQKMTGIPFEDYVEQHFFQPLGMSGATYFYDEEVQKRGATLYNGSKEAEDYWHIMLRPSGSINASIRDMAQFLKLYIGRGTVNGRQIISAESLARMERPASNPGAAAGVELGYGLHNYSSYYDGWYFREHNGSVNNGMSMFNYLPQAKAGFAVLINSGDGMALKQISDVLRKHIVKDLQRPIVEKQRDLTEDQRNWAGYYEVINPRTHMTRGLVRLANIFRVYFNEDQMKIGPLMANWTASEYPVSDVLFQADYTAAYQVALVEDPLAGRVIHFENQVLKPIPAFWVYFKLAALILWSIFMMSAMVYMAVWCALRRKQHPAAMVPLWLHLPPFLASATVIVFFVLNFLALQAPLENLGAPTFYSVGMMLMSILFFALAMVTALGVILAWRVQLSRMLYLYFAITAGLHVLVAFYLLRFDFIGLMTWA